MGISVPSTQYIVYLAQFFGVSTDYLLGVESSAAVSVEGLTDKEIAAIVEVIQCFRARNHQTEYHLN